MAHDHGPEELAALDQRLTDGTLAPEVHGARRAALLAEIGKGKTIELSTGEKLAQVGIVAAVMVVAMVALGVIGSSGGLPPAVTLTVMVLGIAASVILARGYGQARRSRVQ